MCLLLLLLQREKKTLKPLPVTGFAARIPKALALAAGGALVGGPVVALLAAGVGLAIPSKK